MRVIATIIAGAGLLFMSGIAQAVDMGDLDVTIRVIDSDDHDSTAITNEISLPDMSKEVVGDKPGLQGVKSETEISDHSATEGSGGAKEDSLNAKESQDEATQTRESVREEQDSSKSGTIEGTEGTRDSINEIEGDTSGTTTGGESD